MTIYITIGLEAIDEIAWRHYGHQIGTAEAIMNANRGLAARGPRLPPGISITLPEATIEMSTTSRPVKLYD